MKISTNQSLTDDDWLKEYIDGFLGSLAKQGYSRRMIRTYRRNSFRLCRHAEALGMGRQDLDAGLFSALAVTCPKTGPRHMESHLSRTACRRTDDLSTKGVIPQPLPNHQVDDPSVGTSERSWSFGLTRTRGLPGPRSSIAEGSSLFS